LGRAASRGAPERNTKGRCAVCGKQILTKWLPESGEELWRKESDWRTVSDEHPHNRRRIRITERVAKNGRDGRLIYK
jgi:hypothetical protein